MDSITKLAEIIKKRDNKEIFYIDTAKVININPLKLKLKNKIFLSEDYNNLKISDVLDKKIQESIVAKVTVQSVEYNCYSIPNVKINDEIIVVPISDGNLWYAIDKVVM